jgi:hypothetical protein
MIINITTLPDGKVSFDENLVCANPTLRSILNKYGKCGVAYVAYYADISSMYYNVRPEPFKANLIARSVLFDEKKTQNEDIVNACAEFEQYILSTTEGKYLEGFQKKVSELAEDMKSERIEPDTRKNWFDIITSGAKVPKELEAVKLQYREIEETVREKIKIQGRDEKMGEDALSEGEKRLRRKQKVG